MEPASQAKDILSMYVIYALTMECQGRGGYRSRLDLAIAHQERRVQSSPFPEVHSLSAAFIKSYHSHSGIIRRDLVGCRDDNQESEGKVSAREE
jgi:hypothetical protein